MGVTASIWRLNPSSGLMPITFCLTSLLPHAYHAFGSFIRPKSFVRNHTRFDSAKPKRQNSVSGLYSIIISALILSVDFVGMPLSLFNIVFVLLWGFDNCYCFSDIHHVVFTPFCNDNIVFLFYFHWKLILCESLILEGSFYTRHI